MIAIWLKKNKAKLRFLLQEATEEKGEKIKHGD